MIFGWLIRTHTAHFLDEIKYLRDELRFERDRNARLQEQFISLKVERPVVATLPPMPRDDVTATAAEIAQTYDTLEIGAVPG